MRSLGMSLALALALFLVVLIPVAQSAQKGGLADRVAQLEAQVAAMEEILQFVRVETEEIRGVTGPHLIIEGANVHVQSGLGATYQEICPPDHPRSCVFSNGLGNLIVGYNEVPPSPSRPYIRAGMHNLVVGPEHDYNGNGGFIAGRNNETSALGASATGGHDNRAVNSYASVSGGFRNVASGESSSVSGGFDREAEDDFNWAAGSLLEQD